MEKVADERERKGKERQGRWRHEGERGCAKRWSERIMLRPKVEDKREQKNQNKPLNAGSKKPRGTPFSLPLTHTLVRVCRPYLPLTVLFLGGISKCG